MALTRPLTPVEVRILGALMEKEQTTPDAYPLTINALIAACNQKSNREPVTDLTETEVVEALDELRVEVLAWRSQSSRAERWQHCLDRRWHLRPASKAILTLLMLRGPQTPGELRTRSERLHTFESVAQVEAVLAELSAGDDALVLELPRRPGQRETRWAHTVGTEAPLVGVEERPPEPLPGPAAVPRQAGLTERLERLESEVAELRRDLRALRELLGDLG